MAQEWGTRRGPSIRPVLGARRIIYAAVVAAAALQITRRFHHTVLVAAAIGIVSGVVGLYLSYYVSVVSGAAVALVCVAIFLVVAAAARLLARTPRGEPATAVE